MFSFLKKVNWYEKLCWGIAACGGLMFGYDIGISGGVTAMDDFLIKFFPKVHERKLHAKENNYCKFDDQLLQLFTSSLYLAALLASIGASKVCTKFGRKPTITFASLFFIAGAALSAAAQQKWMLIIGRILFGVGVGFGNEAVPVFLSEIAPVKYRGAVNILFQLLVTIGIFIANLVNYSVSKLHPYSWRVALGLAGVPGLFLFLGSFILPETPTSLMERGKDSKGKYTLMRIRGFKNVDEEFDEVKNACDVAKQCKHPFTTLWKKRSSKPPLIIAMCIQAFQQLTGINAIMFYAPVLFQTMGFKNDASLLSAIVTGIVNVASTCIAIFFVDKWGRRKLLLGACVQMFVCQIAIFGFLQVLLKDTGTLNSWVAILVVVLVCFYVMAFAWSWGPMGWLIPSETFPLETRTAGFSCAVVTNMFFTFAIAQSFLSMLCYMKAFIFLFFSVWIVIMGLFVVKFLPETKGVPIDLIVERVWKQHPTWKRFMDDADENNSNNIGGPKPGQMV